MIRFAEENEQVILHTEGMICSTANELVESEVFERIIIMFYERLKAQQSPLLDNLTNDVRDMVLLLRRLTDMPLESVAKTIADGERYLDAKPRADLHLFIEKLYDFWRKYDRFMVLHSEPGPSSFDKRPFRSFNATIEHLEHLVRSTYRDICENISGDHPRIYRQVSAGCNVGLIAVYRDCKIPESYRDALGEVPFIRQAWISPPMIIDPPMNKRTGQFLKIEENPLKGLKLTGNDWMCYPAQVGPLVINIYFHQKFIGLGCTLANLFELATDEQISRGPDAVYAYGVPEEHLKKYGEVPLVFFDDEENGILSAAIPGTDFYGYFGYVKKMVLTLHNVVMMKRGRMPFHGALVHIAMKNGKSANMLLIGDTATGKSETLEAFRLLGKDKIREIRIIADDMGSLEIDGNGKLLGYGTEIGAFIRLDDLADGYAFEQIDRAIIMSPQKINARVVLPVTTLDDILKGVEVDYLLYANNYEEVDEYHPLVDKFETVESALTVFREGAAMAKGTTTSTGLVHSYFANIFGAPQYRELHEKLAQATFEAAHKNGTFIGVMRTRLGIPGNEMSGPQDAARSLLKLMYGEG